MIDLPHFGGDDWGHTKMGPMTMKFELGRDFYTVHLPTKFHHPVFNRTEVMGLTNKQRDSVENTHLAALFYATPVVVFGACTQETLWRSA